MTFGVGRAGVGLVEGGAGMGEGDAEGAPAGLVDGVPEAPVAGEAALCVPLLPPWHEAARTNASTRQPRRTGRRCQATTDMARSLMVPRSPQAFLPPAPF